MKKDKKLELFELLLLNSSEKLKKFLISKGKSGKAVCPIMFVDNEKPKEEKYGR